MRFCCFKTVSIGKLVANLVSKFLFVNSDFKVDYKIQKKLVRTALMVLAVPPALPYHSVKVENQIMAAKKPKQEKKTLVKCYVSPDDHQLIRMAAAQQNSTIDDFVAQAAVAKAKTILANFAAKLKQ